MKRLRADSIVYGGSTVIVRALTFAALAVYARMLTPTDMGVISILAIVGLATNSIFSLEISQGLMRYCSGAPEATRLRYFATGLWFVVVSSLIALVVILGFSGEIALLLFSQSTRSSDVLVYLSFTLLTGLFSLLQSQCRSEMLRNEFAFITLSSSIISFVASIIFGLVADHTLTGIVLGQSFGVTLGIILALAYLRAPSVTHADLKTLKEILKYTIPLVPSVLSILAGTYINRLALNKWGTLEDVAVFTIASQISVFVTLALVGIQSALTPLVIANHDSPETPLHLQSLFDTFWFSAVLLCLLIGIVAEPMIALLFPPTYLRGSSWIFPLSVATLLWQIYIFWPGFTIRHKTSAQMFITIGSSIASVVINLLAIYYYGIEGAVAGALLGGTIFIFSWVSLSDKYYTVPISLWRSSIVLGFGVTCYTIFRIRSVDMSLYAICNGFIGVVVYLIACRLYVKYGGSLLVRPIDHG